MESYLDILLYITTNHYNISLGDNKDAIAAWITVCKVKRMVRQKHCFTKQTIVVVYIYFYIYFLQQGRFSAGEKIPLTPKLYEFIRISIAGDDFLLPITINALHVGGCAKIGKLSYIIC